MNDTEAQFLKLHITTLLDLVRSAQRRAERAEAKLGRARAQIRALQREANKPPPPYLGGVRVVSRITPELRDHLASQPAGCITLTVHKEGEDWLGDFDVPLVDIVGMPGDRTLCLRINSGERRRDMSTPQAEGLR